ncbi:hypothetical protein C8R44DRAFT_594061, partial [Mycena epipterygia]
RPKAVKDWIARARKWENRVELGVVGRQGKRGTFVDNWWKWWMGLQPSERQRLGGMLSCPTEADWNTLSKVHGKNGLLQVMATLLWWGDCVGDDRESVEYDSWTLALGDVSWVLSQL